ncbi:MULTISPECIES: sensor histidine kinase [Pseudomonas]|uniref:sensor histidine kinase n=1 Tax=Pseudomonas TaxID=286 RepID=UPI0001E295E8|nr:MULTISPECIES: HAMP domain-containing sensor histidine kinase [Pseudomonas]KFE45134.1 histidine kinase [Pseudomonas congelans]MBC8801752.1 HAMP domain-containing histidine kinase [Pseudomonas congelans]MBP1143886.1 signal transduction histidine kinase [Pseudomonas sp. PvP027]MCF5164750.1 HAMP domain-containing protein [Pseudomonas congelans]PBP95559.1 sensor histidine kinase [Pseudomonas congelans]
MIRRFDTLFARLFGGALLAIMLAHLLAFIWFTQYGMRPPPEDRPDAQHAQDDRGQRHRPPPGGPLVVLFFQFVTLIVAAWYGAKALARPVQRLSEAAERLSENLDSPALEIIGPKEARQAAQTFNLMQRKIREQMQQRGRMLAAVSHDLRTPLSRLKLRVEQIEEPKLHGQMTQDLNDMISMLDATLAYLNEHRRNEGLQQFDLQALIESQAENAQDNGDDVQYEGQCKPLKTQPMALRSCLQNLVDNALRYAGSAHIVIEDSLERVRISVVDHGPGIAPEFHETVFEPFYRLESSRNRNSGGIGMGMSIAREAARRIGGDLTLAQTPGGGLTAILNLPRL